MNKIKIALVTNNYGAEYDGVGNFAKVQKDNFSEGVVCEVYTSECTYEVSKLKRFTQLNMFKEITKVVKDLEKEQYCVVVLEYPFVEWNPMILLPLRRLKNKLKKQKKHFVISLHEYERVNILRKMVIQKLCKWADLVFVANEEMKNAICDITSSVTIRPIPTNLYSKEAMEQEIAKDRKVFSYFGLVNSAKAFDEMLQAWDQYNLENDNELYVLTATPLTNIEESHKGVHYLYCKGDYEILKIMKQSIACFIPVKPEVDMKNGTFKTASITGCVCIGKFCEEYRKLPFIINMEGYSTQDFIKAMNELESITDDRLEKMRIAAGEFGSKYTPKQTSFIVEQEIRRLIGE